MPFSSHILEFVEFILLGIVLGLVFDFFRAYRKIKKSSQVFVTIQDIIYFAICLIIIVLGVLLFLKTEIRIYIFMAIIIGVILYEKLLSKLFMKIIISFYKVFNDFFKFLIIPITLLICIINKIYIFLNKIIKKCCKKFIYVILIIKRVVFCIFKKQKREKYEKKGRAKGRSSKKRWKK